MIRQTSQNLYAPHNRALLSCGGTKGIDRKHAKPAPPPRLPWGPIEFGRLIVAPMGVRVLGDTHPNMSCSFLSAGKSGAQG